VPLTSDKTTIARTATDPVAAWRNEAGPVAESDPTFDGVVLEPKSLAVLFKAWCELIEDSVNIEAALEAALRGALAVELDRFACAVLASRRSRWASLGTTSTCSQQSDRLSTMTRW
jgi:HK97 family phage major capsid protein